MSEKLTLDRMFSGASLAGPAPRELQISPDGRRVSFLRARSDDQFQLDLWAYDLADHRSRLLVEAATLHGAGEPLSEAHKARRERERRAGLRGILSYQWSPNARQLLFPLDDKLYLYDLAAAAPRLLETGGEALDPKFSPRGRYVSYLQGQNLWRIELASGQRRQLTHDGGGSVHNGEAEFVAQEEMARPTGYWWAPDEHAIAFERYDEAGVPMTLRSDFHAERSTLVEQRYPFAGAANVAVALGLVDPAGGAIRWVALGDDPDIYLCRVDWRPDAKYLSFQRMRRDQCQLDLQLVDVATLAQRTVLSETSACWVNLNDDLHFLDNGDFIWGSERSGYHQLYLYAADGQLKHALGRGAWAIDGLLAVDQARGLAYVSANRDSVPERQLYAVQLDGGNAAQPRRISQGAGTHQVTFAADGSFYVDTYSSVSTPPQVSVHRPDGEHLGWIERNTLDAQHPFWPYREAQITPQFGTLRAEDGQLLHYRLYTPTGFDPAQRYPVFDSYYGGPHAQSVVDSWGDYFNQYMAQQGFVVFTLDNRGMARRGRAFEDPIHRQLGVVEVEDQLTGIRWLKSQPWVDGARIGVFGWSYGGYLTTLLLAKASAEIAGGVAVAPVTDWTLYDTFYTERYLGRPQDNPVGYARSAPFAWLDGLRAKLCLVHGMADDNVLFLNTTKLIAALQQRDIPFQLMTYPGGKHALAEPGQRSHVHRLIADFFEQQIKRAAPAGVDAREIISTG
jgi:dipeptidyl-peptidase-4